MLSEISDGGDVIASETVLGVASPWLWFEGDLTREVGEVLLGGRKGFDMSWTFEADRYEP